MARQQAGRGNFANAARIDQQKVRIVSDSNRPLAPGQPETRSDIRSDQPRDGL
jgi:hypothetical protein